MNGVRALELGMVSEIVPLEQLDAAVRERAERMAKAGPHALRATKRLLNELAGEALEAAVRKGAHISAEVVAGEEAQRMLGKIYGG